MAKGTREQGFIDSSQCEIEREGVNYSVAVI